MNEYDSGSDGDSSSESTSSSDAASSGGGIDFSPIVQNLLDDVLEPRRSSPIGPPLPPGEERQRRAQYEKTLREILFSTEPIPDRRSLVRRVVEVERWFLPTTPDGDFERLSRSDDTVAASVDPAARARRARAPACSWQPGSDWPGSGRDR